MLPRIMPCGECALTVEFGTTIDQGINGRVLALDAAVTAAEIDGVSETMPTYRSLYIEYDPLKISFEALSQQLLTLEGADLPAKPAPCRWCIPVCFADDFADDMETVSAATGLEKQAIIHLLCTTTFRIFMFGFAPGYGFLGGLPDTLEIARRRAPRQQVPAGSLLIAGGQCVLSTLEMPSGWHIIGRSPERVFMPSREEAIFLAVGDEVQFKEVSLPQFDQLTARVSCGEIVSSAVSAS